MAHLRVFVTGGTGFIGRHAINELKKRGHRLLVLSRLPAPPPDSLRDSKWAGRVQASGGQARKTRRERGVDFIKGDLSDIQKWKWRLKKFKPQAAVHLAWEGIPDFSYAQSVKNLEGGLVLFAALADIGCKKIVATGSGFEYGDYVGRVYRAMCVTPKNSFVAAKHALHLMGEELTREKGMDFIWFRAFNVYGGAQRAGSLIPYIMRCIVRNVPLRLKNPLAQGDFVYVADMARAIADAVARGKGRATYSVGSGRLTPVKDIAKMVCEEMGTSKEYYKDFARTAKGKLAGSAYAELKNSREELGWHPTIDIKTGIKKTVVEFLNSNS